MATEKKDEINTMEARGTPSYFSLPETTFKQIKHKWDHLSHENLELRIPAESKLIKKELERVGELLAEALPAEIKKDLKNGKVERPARYAALYEEITGKKLPKPKPKPKEG